MHPVMNHLIQLQELTLIRDEQRVAAGGLHLEQLDASIRGMTAQLPNDVRQSFEKLRKKDRIAVAPVAGNNCAGCGMQLAISHIQAVRLGRRVEICPNCARILYYPAAVARRLGISARRTVPRKVGISRFSDDSLMIPELESSEKEGALRELASKMEAGRFIDDGKMLLEEALRREAILSTAVEHGLAFPHARGIEGGGLALALGISHKGIPFDNHSKSLSKIIFFIAIPTAASAFYLKLLAGLAETFTEGEARKAIMAEKDAAGLWKTLVKVTKKTIK